ncbi:MAG: hypothetical protein AB7N80_02580 [Bdellovibrionales bacterium]
MKTIFKSIIFALMTGQIGFSASLAFANEGAKPAIQPKNDLDNWDDDVWADWGAQPSATAKDAQDNVAPAAPDLSNKDGNASASAGFGGGSFGGGTASGGTNGFGETTDKIRFRLVREGENNEPKGVRKYRPSYGKKRSL